MKNYSTKETKHSVKVDGKMNEIDAGLVGHKLANAALIFATGSVVAMIISAISLLM